MKRVVVTGIGLVTPIGLTKEFRNGIFEGKNGADLITRFDASDVGSKVAAEVKDFDPTPWIDKKDLKRMDLATQYAVVAAAQAMEDAELEGKFDPERAGVIVGSGIGGIGTVVEQTLICEQRGARRVSPFMIPMLIVNIPAATIAIRWGFEGVNFAVVTACASAAHSIGEAFWKIRSGQLDVALAGGTEAAIIKVAVAGFSNMRALTTRNDDPEHASRPFDKNRDGFLMGEGAGILVLEELEHAKKRGAKIYAEIVGYGANDDAYHMTAPHPEAKGMAKCMELALKDAGIKPEDIGYINAHGTSTPLNDKTETLAIKKVFGDHAYKLKVSSTKSMIGHLLGATGAVEAAAVVYCLQEQKVHPTINYEEPDPDCDLDYTPNKAVEWEFEYALSNSFGFGGHNASLVFRKWSE